MRFRGYIKNPYRYNAERVDYVPGIADFQYLRARYYRPDMARFITQDTVWGNINVPLTQNLYAYVGNNPINRIDPSGMSWLDDAWGWVVENKDAIIATAVTVATAVVITAAVVATAGAAAAAIGVTAGIAASSVGASAAVVSTAMTVGTVGTYVVAGTIVAANATTVVGSVSQLATGSNVVVDGMTYAMGGTAEAWQKAYQINNGIGMYGMFAGSAFAQYGAQAQSAGYGSQKTAQAQQGSQRQGCDGGQKLDVKTVPQQLTRDGKAPVIGKMKDLNADGALSGNEFKVADYLPDKGSPQANWHQNSGILRSVMNERVPIRDASIYPMNNAGFLGLERKLLQDRGWTYSSGYWLPPQ